MSDPAKAVFLSYASQDAAAAKRISDALRAAGVEVWFDAEGGLEHGDEWDAKIRRQIKECVLFLPIISASTQAREEGYFRIEWDLAAERARGIASGVAFILPIVIDDTPEPAALVPDRFRAVQWTRLRGGELTPEVKARFLKLWSHRAGMVTHESSRSVPPSGERPELVAKPGWKAYAGLAAAVFALAAGAAWFALRSSPSVSTPHPAAPTAKPAPQVPLSEARQLAERARILFDALESSRDDFKLAEELLAKARAKDDTDAEVDATESQLHSRYLQRGWDPSDARREAARATAQRALRLDPRSFEARVAVAFQLGDTGREGEEKAQKLQELRRERPADQRVLRGLGTTLNRLGQFDEGNRLLDESAALPGGDPLAFYNKSLNFWFAGRTVEADQAIQASLAQRPFTGALLVSGWYAAFLHGDTDRAREILGRIPPQDMQQDRAAFFAWYTEMLAHQPGAAITVVQAMPRDWLNDSWFRGPRSLLVGDALSAAGRTEAAMAEWRSALKLVEERLAANPTGSQLQALRVQLLADLGERGEAEKQFAVLTQRLGIDPAGAKPVPGWITSICVRLGRKAEAIRQINLGLQRERRAVDYTAAALRLDPEYDSLRGEPEFAKVIAQAEAIESEAAPARPARDWPKDPQLRQAFDIITGLDATIEACRLAEDIIDAVLKQRPTDPDATTVYAMMNNYYINRGYDQSEERHVLARRFAERALQLAPGEPEALAAMAQFLTFRGTDYTRAEDLIRKAIALAPQEPRFGRILAYNVLRATKLPRGMAQARENAARFPRDPLTQYDLALICRGTGDLELMEKALDRTLALAPLGSALIWKGWLAAWVHGDLPGFKTWLDRISGNFRLNERTVYMRYLYACLSGDTAYGLEAVNSFPGLWMNDFYFTGPRALLEADLVARQGKSDLARTEYDRALAEIRRAAEREPSNTAWERAEFWALLGAGRLGEAQAVNKRLLQRLDRPYRPIIMQWWHDSIPAELLIGNRPEALALIREAVVAPAVRAQIRTAFKIDHRMAPFREDPEIVALLAGPEVKK